MERRIARFYQSSERRLGTLVSAVLRKLDATCRKALPFWRLLACITVESVNPSGTRVTGKTTSESLPWPGNGYPCAICWSDSLGST